MTGVQTCALPISNSISHVFRWHRNNGLWSKRRLVVVATWSRGWYAALRPKITKWNIKLKKNYILMTWLRYIWICSALAGYCTSNHGSTCRYEHLFICRHHCQPTYQQHPFEENSWTRAGACPMFPWYNGFQNRIAIFCKKLRLTKHIKHLSNVLNYLPANNNVHCTTTNN